MDSTAQPDWVEWADTPRAEDWKAVALSLGIDPHGMRHHPQGWMAGGVGGPYFRPEAFPTEAVKQEFEKRLRIVRANAGAGGAVEGSALANGGYIVNLRSFLAWARTRWRVPHEWAAAIGHLMRRPGTDTSFIHDLAAEERQRSPLLAPAARYRVRVPRGARFMLAALIPKAIAEALVPERTDPPALVGLQKKVPAPEYFSIEELTQADLVLLAEIWRDVPGISPLVMFGKHDAPRSITREDFAPFQHAFDKAPDRPSWMLLPGFIDPREGVNSSRQDIRRAHWEAIEAQARAGTLRLISNQGVPAERIELGTQISVEDARAYLAGVPPGFVLVESSGSEAAAPNAPLAVPTAVDAQPPGADALSDLFALALALEEEWNGSPIEWDRWTVKSVTLTAAQAVRLMAGLDPERFEQLAFTKSGKAGPAKAHARRLEQLAEAEQPPKLRDTPAGWLAWADAKRERVHSPYRVAIEQAAKAAAPAEQAATVAAPGTPAEQWADAKGDMKRKRELAHDMVERCQGNKTKAAERLGTATAQLYRALNWEPQHSKRGSVAFPLDQLTGGPRRT